MKKNNCQMILKFLKLIMDTTIIYLRFCVRTSPISHGLIDRSIAIVLLILWFPITKI